MPNNSAYGSDFTQEAFIKALNLIKEAVQDERTDEMTYEYLLGVAPTQEEKDIIMSIRDDERNHRKWFREIYKMSTGQNLENADEEDFTPPASYIEGISKAVMGELGAMEKYRMIREGLPSRYYRDVVFQILTDEMKHATKYNYILNKNAIKPVKSNSLFQATKSNEKTPDEWVSFINPLVKRSIEEQREGVNLEHLLQEFILSGVLVGLGKNPMDAIDIVENWEITGESRLLRESRMR